MTASRFSTESPPAIRLSSILAISMTVIASPLTDPPNNFRRRKNHMKKLDATRRRFMAHFAGIGLGTTLVPGILWARMQDAGAQTVSLAMVTDALKLAGLEFSEEDRNAMVATANRSL